MNLDLLLQLVVNGLIVGLLYGVVGMCFVLVYKSTQIVNFAQGEFLLVGAAASSVFFLLMVMALIDVVAGFTVSITSAGRDVTMN